jgi:hypothetical protein
MSLINKKYEKVVCISLKERNDKFQFAKKQFEKHNIEVEFFRPVIHNYIRKFSELYADKYNIPTQNKILFNKEFSNELSVMQSFYHVIKNATLDGIQNLFIFEDDFQMHKNWDELLPKYFNSVPSDADAILLYSYMSNLNPENIRVSSRWTKGYKSWSHIAIGMNRKYMEEYIKQIDNCPRIGDLVSYQMMEKEFNVYIASPPLGVPAKQFNSDIRGKNKNYDKPQFIGGNIFMLGINDNDYE